MLGNKQIGDKGELIAIKYLQKKGYKIIETNYIFSKFGEIDIISKKGDITCFIEVKFRNNISYGYPEEAITKSKLSKLRMAIENYTIENGIDFEKIQFDVITIIKKDKYYQLKHYKNIEI